MLVECRLLSMTGWHWPRRSLLGLSGGAAARERNDLGSRFCCGFLNCLCRSFGGGDGELIAAAGGNNLFGEAGKHSGWMQWDEIIAADPDAVVVAPCGYGLARCLEELPLLQAKPGWNEIDAVRRGRVYFADGNAFFNRPGPRLANSTELLAQMLHPGIFAPRDQGTAWVTPDRLA